MCRISGIKYFLFLTCDIIIIILYRRDGSQNKMQSTFKSAWIFYIGIYYYCGVCKQLVKHIKQKLGIKTQMVHSLIGYY